MRTGLSGAGSQVIFHTVWSVMSFGKGTGTENGWQKPFAGELKDVFHSSLLQPSERNSL